MVILPRTFGEFDFPALFYTWRISIWIFPHFLSSKCRTEKVRENSNSPNPVVSTTILYILCALKVSILKWNHHQDIYQRMRCGKCSFTPLHTGHKKCMCNIMQRNGIIKKRKQQRSCKGFVPSKSLGHFFMVLRTIFASQVVLD